MEHLDPEWIAQVAIMTPVWLVIGWLARRTIRTAENRRQLERRR